MNISILEGYPFCVELPAEHPCSSVCLRGGGILSGAFLHIGTASLDDKGSLRLLYRRKRLAYRVPDAYPPNMPVSGVPWATEVESSPHPGSGECAEDFNNSLTSKETAMKTVISTSKAPAAIGPYSQAIRKGDTLYLSGQIGMVPATGELVSDDVKEQTAQALANMKAILAEAGATPADVTKVTVFIVDMAEFQIVNGVYSETFGADAPARSCVAVAALPKGARGKSKPSPSCKCFVSAFTYNRFFPLFLTLGSPRVLRMGRSGLLLPERLSGKTGRESRVPLYPTREPIGASARDKKPRTGQGFYSVGKWARRWERAVLGFCSASQIWASRSAESA